MTTKDDILDAVTKRACGYAAREVEPGGREATARSSLSLEKAQGSFLVA